MESTDSFYDTETDCSLPDLVASTTKYDVVVDVPPFGYAVTNMSSSFKFPQLTSLLEVNELQPFDFNVSMHGCLNITITGEGFSDSLTVTVCNETCQTVITSFTSLTCTLPARLTCDGVDEVRSLGLGSDLISNVRGTLFSTAAPQELYDLSVVNDGDYETYTNLFSTICAIGVHLPFGYAASPFRLRFYPRFLYAAYISTIIFEGSNDEGNTYVFWRHPQSFTKDGTLSTNTSSQWYTSLRFRYFILCPGRSRIPWNHRFYKQFLSNYCTIRPRFLLDQCRNCTLLLLKSIHSCDKKSISKQWLSIRWNYCYFLWRQSVTNTHWF